MPQTGPSMGKARNRLIILVLLIARAFWISRE